MSQPVAIPDELYKHLVERAEMTRISIETLVTHLLENALSPAAGSDLLFEITQAYARGTAPPVVGSWDQVETELATTISPFESLEAALVSARGRR